MCGRLHHMLFAFSVAPAGLGDESLGDIVAEAVRVVRESGLPHETTSMFRRSKPTPGTRRWPW